MKGWPINSRLAVFILSDCSVAVLAELDESSNACAGTTLLDARPQVLLEFDALGTVLLHEIDVRPRRDFEVCLETQAFFEILGRQAQCLERGGALRM